MNEQLIELKKYFEEKGMEVSLYDDDKRIRIYHEKMYRPISLFYRNGNIIVSNSWGPAPLDKSNEGYELAARINSFMSFVRCMAWENGDFRITCENQFPADIPSVAMCVLVDKLVDDIIDANKYYYPKYERLRKSSVPPPQTPIHTPEQKHTEEDDWLFDVTKF